MFLDIEYGVVVVNVRLDGYCYVNILRVVGGK